MTTTEQPHDLESGTQSPENMLSPGEKKIITTHAEEIVAQVLPGWEETLSNDPAILQNKKNTLPDSDSVLS